MSIQNLKYSAYDKITPEFAQRHFAEHGREIANAESFARLVMSPYLFNTAATGKKGVVPGITRVLKIVMDGHDGFVAHQDKDFHTAEPTVHSGFDMTKKAAGIFASPRDGLKEKLAAARQLLHDTNGQKVDPDFDKMAQLSDQVGGMFNGDVSKTFVAINIGRIAWIDGGVRPAYTRLGVSSGATTVSQVKTVVHDTMQAAESFGIFDRYPGARSMMSKAGVAMTIWSAVDIMMSSERAYLESINYPSETVDTPQLLLNSAGRTLMHLKGAEIPTAPRL